MIMPLSVPWHTNHKSDIPHQTNQTTLETCCSDNDREKRNFRLSLSRSLALSPALSVWPQIVNREEDSVTKSWMRKRDIHTSERAFLSWREGGWAMDAWRWKRCNIRIRRWNPPLILYPLSWLRSAPPFISSENFGLILRIFGLLGWDAITL